MPSLCENWLRISGCRSTTRKSTCCGRRAISSRPGEMPASRSSTDLTADRIATGHTRPIKPKQCYIGFCGVRGRPVWRASCPWSGRRIRPLIDCTRAEVRQYFFDSYSWREDVTNADTSFARNHIRHRDPARLARQPSRTNSCPNSRTGAGRRSILDRGDRPAGGRNYLQTKAKAILINADDLSELPLPSSGGFYAARFGK